MQNYQQVFSHNFKVQGAFKVVDDLNVSQTRTDLSYY